MLVRHVRDWNGAIVATVVATAADKIGVSVCNAKDRPNKRLGIEIAKGRAEKVNVDEFLESNVPNRYFYIPYTYENLQDILVTEVNQMKVRAKRYFK